MNERTERVCSMTRAGKSAPEIAAILGITTRTVMRHRKAAGIAQPPRPPVSPEQIEQMRQMLDDGASREEVARTLGLHSKTVRYHFPDRKWSHAQAGGWRWAA